jgi:radical SAM protein with 4Fe4S-binding SPASM domain
MCQRAPCGAGITMLAFDVDGNLYPCDTFMGSKEYQIATLEELKKNNLIKMRFHPKVKELSTRNFSTIRSCRKCKWRFFCGFGCTGESTMLFNDIFHKPLYCEYYKLLFPYLFEKIEKSPNIISYMLGRDIEKTEITRLMDERAPIDYRNKLKM